MEADKHLVIIRSRLQRLLRELEKLPVLNKNEISPVLAGLLLELDGRASPRAEPTGRAITFTELRKQLTGMPGARPVLEAIDSALADGAD